MAKNWRESSCSPAAPGGTSQSRLISGLVSYTWGKALTNAVDHLSTSGVGNGTDVGVFKEAQNGYDREGILFPALESPPSIASIFHLPFGGLGLRDRSPALWRGGIR